MNARVARRARLILRRLIVCRTARLRRCEVRRWRVALQAQRVHARTIDQPRIRSSVREMASCAAFCLHHKVLVDKRSRRLAMALRADRIHLR